MQEERKHITSLLVDLAMLRMSKVKKKKEKKRVKCRVQITRGLGRNVKHQLSLKESQWCFFPFFHVLLEFMLAGEFLAKNSVLLLSNSVTRVE